MKNEKERTQKKVGKRDGVAEKGKEGRRIKTETERVRDERQKGIRECDRRERKEQREKDRIEGKERDGEKPKDWSPTLRLSLTLTYLTTCFLLLGCYSLGTP